ncbi:MAG: L-2-amino-thiazoline-4-carboxylic acid hydrolase [Deltaproteobacteria bacterium]|nr:L-2-amino-thiazoline-4-carboxylic acid hydrolase [Deltaproteobacteria bacterium]
MLVRREIEARMAAPFVRALVRELGEKRGLVLVQEIIASMAREAGMQLAKAMGGNTLAHFAEGLKFWTKDNALEIEVVEQSASVFAFNVTRCRYAEMYRELGMRELGIHLSCARDFALMEGFNPGIRLVRTHTILEGAETCDFRYEALKGG